MPKELEETELEEVEDLEEEETEQEEEEYEEEEEEVSTVDAEDESIEDEENPTIPVVYKDENGKLVEEEISYKDLGDIVKEHKINREYLKQYVDYYQQIQPLIDTIKNSELIRSLLYYKAQGYSEDQILDAYVKNKSQTKIEPEYETYEEELKHKLLSEIEKKIAPIQQQVATRETLEQINETSRFNNQILGEVMKEMNVEGKIDEKDLQLMGKFLSETYPGVDLRFLKINKTIAKSMLNYVLSEKKTKLPNKVVSKINKIKSLPKVVESKDIRRSGNKRDEIKTGRPLSLEERIALKHKLFG